jgi:hypothetical protein
VVVVRPQLPVSVNFSLCVSNLKLSSCTYFIKLKCLTYQPMRCAYSVHQDGVKGEEIEQVAFAKDLVTCFTPYLKFVTAEKWFTDCCCIRRRSVPN